jgi:uncharacterized MAPEG superfamily protein
MEKNMTTAYWMVLVAAFMPYIFTTLSKTYKKLDNEKPRIYLDAIPDNCWQKRMDWAQKNSMEIFPIFASAIIIGHLANVSQAHLDEAAQLFIASRILYGVCYYKNWSKLRTLIWFVGFASIVWIFV